MTNKYIILLFLSCISFRTQAQTLEQYLEIAAENNPNLKAKFADFQAALERVSQVNTLADPNVSFGYFIQPVQTRVGPQQLKIGLSQMLPWFGELKAKESVAALVAESKHQEFEDAKNDLFQKVKSDWFTLYALNQQVHFLKEYVQINYIYKDLATEAFKNGKSSMADVLRTDIVINELESQITVVKQQIVPVKASFNGLLNRPVNSSIEIPTELNVLDTTTNLFNSSSLKSSNPISTTYDLRLQALEYEAIVIQKQNKPKLGVGLDYVAVSKLEGSSSPKNGQDVFMPMVSVSLPIYGRKNQARVKEIEFKQVSVDSSWKNYLNSLEVRLEKEYFELFSAQETIELMDIQIAQTKQVISLLTIAYGNSGKDFEEILRMEQNVLNYKIKKVMAESKTHKAVAAIEYLTGTTL